jgi:hypothetical protein
VIATDDLKAFLGYPDEEGVTELLEVLEPAAVQLVEDETGRFFGASETRTEYIIGDGTRDLHLAENATAITSVGARRHIGDSFDTITEGDSDGFEIRAPRADSGRARLLRKGSLWWLDGYEYRVIYAFGYTAGAEPGRIRQAVMDLVALKYHSRGREGLRSWEAGGVRWAQFTSITELDVHLIPGLSRTLGLWRARPMVLQ